ncbi:MAG: carboxypeptidase-like regulatory domain-containing protein [Flavobacteriales bacterium]
MKLTITVPKPCHEDWGAMRAQPVGRFCDSCQHTVTDLTRASDAELVALFSGDARPKCARFDPAQLDRVLASERERNPVHALQATVLSSALALGTTQMMAQTTLGEPAMKGKVTTVDHMVRGEAKCVGPTELASASRALVGDTVAVVIPDDEVMPIVMDGVMMAPEETFKGQPILQPAPQEGVVVTGTVCDQDDMLPFANVTLEGTTIRAVTDFDGRFVLQLPNDRSLVDAMIRVRVVGYSDRLIPVQSPPIKLPSDALLTDLSAPRGNGSISGLVRDRDSKPLPHVLVAMQGTGLYQYTDGSGFFAFDPPDGYAGRMVELKVGSDSTAVLVEVPSSRIPFCAPVRLDRSVSTAIAIKKPDVPIDVGVVRMSSGLRMMGVMAVTKIEPTFGERVAAPFRRAGRWVGDLVR